MTGWLPHLIILPILLPLVASALKLSLDERRRATKRALGLGTAALLIIVAAILLWFAREGGPVAYRLGDWPSPFAITLVADRLSTMMLLLTSLLGLTSDLYATARWDRSGRRCCARSSSTCAPRSCSGPNRSGAR